MTDQAAKPQRVVSRNTPANELIATLRAHDAIVAKGIAELGDAVHEAEGRIHGALEHEHEARTDADDARAELDHWRLLLEDYRRGLVDRDELLVKTVGRG